MKVFITASFGNKDEIDKLCLIVRNSGFTDYCFARDEGYFDNPKKMMDKAKKEIEACDALLFDASKTSVGRLIEVGIAFSLKKKILVIAKEGTPIKDTLIGVTDSIITYTNIEDIQNELNKLFNDWDR